MKDFSAKERVQSIDPTATCIRIPSYHGQWKVEGLKFLDVNAELDSKSPRVAFYGSGRTNSRAWQNAAAKMATIELNSKKKERNSKPKFNYWAD